MFFKKDYGNVTFFHFRCEMANSFCYATVSSIFQIASFKIKYFKYKSKKIIFKTEDNKSKETKSVSKLYI